MYNFFKKLHMYVACFLMFFAFSFSFTCEKKAFAKETYIIGVLAGAEIHYYSDILIETVNLMNSKDFQETHAFDKQVLFEHSSWAAFLDNDKLLYSLDEQAKILQEDDNVDLIIAIGASSAKMALKYNTGKKPIFIISEHELVESGIIKSYDDSGYDNVTAFIKEEHVLNDFALIAKKLGFNTLGIIELNKTNLLENSFSKSYADQIEPLLFKEDIKLQRFFINEDSIEAVKTVLPEVFKAKPDALIVVALKSFELNENVHTIFQFLIEQNIAPISPRFHSLAEQGALLGYSMRKTEFISKCAKIIMQLLKGVPARSLEMKHSYFADLKMNIIVANELELFLPYDVLAMCTDFYYSKPSQKTPRNK